MTVVDILHRTQHLRIISGAMARANKSLHILGETTAAISTPSVDKVIPNPLVASNAKPDLVHIRPQHVLRHFRAGNIHKDKIIVVPNVMLVQFPHYLRRIVIVRSNDDPVRAAAIADRRALLQKLRIGDDIKCQIASSPLIQFLLDCCPDKLRRSNRYCGLVHNVHMMLHSLANLLGHCQDILQICAAIFPRWRSNRYKTDCCLL